ncbi:hypothetical protein KBC70_02750 [Candidatus Woesebacteria bacterium]|nr:hypothetical protein [Candidatus Woesebacteria bacterium]
MPRRIPDPPLLNGLLAGAVTLKGAPGADTIPKEDAKPPSWLSPQAFALWDRIANSRYCDIPGGINFSLPLASEELLMAWELYTYGGCTMPNEVGTSSLVVLMVEGNRIPTYDGPPDSLGTTSQQYWRKLYVRGRGLEWDLPSGAPLYDQYLGWARSLQMTDAATLTETRKGAKIRLVPKGGQVTRRPASAEVVEKQQTFYSDDDELLV